MKKTLWIALLSLTLGAGVVAPVQAAEREDPMTSTLLLPVRLAALGAGIVVGTPVASVRETLKSYPDTRDYLANEVFGAKSDPDVGTLAVAGITAMPISIANGVLQGFGEGTKNALDYCMEKPFSAESFSLMDAK